MVDFIHETVQRGYPLTVQLDTFVTKILIDNNGYAPRAFGVAYEYGPNLQYTSPLATGAHGVPGYVFARREVIISCGAYETPSECVGAPMHRGFTLTYLCCRAVEAEWYRSRARTGAMGNTHCSRLAWSRLEHAG